MKCKYQSLLRLVVTWFALLPTAYAHNLLWINVVPEFDRQVVSSLGYGDSMSSGSELLTPSWWPITISAYDVIDPNGLRSPLGLITPKPQATQTLASGIQFQPESDTGRRKFILGKHALKGTYQVYASTHVTRVLVYQDKKGDTVYLNTAIDSLPKGSNVTGEGYNILLCKAVFTHQQWSEPAPLGMPLEIMPLTDLSQAGSGDLVRFKVLKNGDVFLNEAHLLAYNASYGDKWGMISPLVNGIGEFRIPNAGPWRISIGYEGKSSDFNAYKEMKDILMVMESTLVFNIKP
ncbi:MAG: DUF4198 domain-containing protein [Paraglaciecola sp.]|nr:DUF4198 domain-containing protein [Paraglaciecola sp.]